MSRIVHATVLAAALVSALAAMTSTAGAVTWHNSGDTAFTATSPAFTFSATNANLSCGTQVVTGVVTPTPSVGVVFAAITMTWTAPSCLFVGNNMPWECKRTFTATAQAGSVTSGTLDTTCTIFAGSSAACEISGSVPATYTNPGGLHLPTSSSLVTQRTPGGCVIGYGGDVLEISAMVLTIENATGGPFPHQGPVLTRTA